MIMICMFKKNSITRLLFHVPKKWDVKLSNFLSTHKVKILP